MAFARTTQPSELLELTREDLEACSLQFSELRSAWKDISYKRLAHMKELLSQNEIERTREAMV
jgi:hypothetical protein